MENVADWDQYQYGPDDSLASFSNFGQQISMAAPGVDILSTYIGGGYAT